MRGRNVERIGEEVQERQSKKEEIIVCYSTLYYSNHHIDLPDSTLFLWLHIK